MRPEPIVVLGATGSIGTQTLEILRFSFDYRLVGVSFSSHYEKLEPFLLYFDALKYVAIQDEQAAEEFRQKHPDYILFVGKNANLELLEACSQATVFNSLMGNCGLLPSLKAIHQNQDLLLSNKESLVIGSSLIKEALRHSKSHLYPVDSEHVALAKLLDETRRLGIARNAIERLIVTASGGSLRDMSIDDLNDVTPQTVLHHPTWAMGAKITVDSATLVNKGYEVIEASVLFDMPLDKVGAIICRESLVHAELTYRENGQLRTLMEYSPCDMKVAIAYALSKGTLGMHVNSPSDLKAIESLHFGTVDPAFYPLFGTTIKTFETYGNLGMIYYNAMDSLAIESFLKGEIRFTDIRECLAFTYESLGRILKTSPSLSEENLDAIEANAQREARQSLLKVSIFTKH